MQSTNVIHGGIKEEVVSSLKDYESLDLKIMGGNVDQYIEGDTHPHNSVSFSRNILPRWDPRGDGPIILEKDYVRYLEVLNIVQSHVKTNTILRMAENITLPTGDELPSCQLHVDAEEPYKLFVIYVEGAPEGVGRFEVHSEENAGEVVFAFDPPPGSYLYIDELGTHPHLFYTSGGRGVFRHTIITIYT